MTAPWFLSQGLGWDFRRIFFRGKGGQALEGVLREVVESPFLGVSKEWWDVALSSLVGLTRWRLDTGWTQ